MDIMSTLTAREQEALRLLMAGKRRGEIAAEMCIERGTVKAYLRRARDKAGVGSTVELVAKVAREVGE